MANFVDCGTNSFDFHTYANAILAEEQNLALAETGQYAIRIVEVTADRDTEVITCNTHDSLFDLFKQALYIADDGKPALRVVITNRANGAALEDVPNCGDYEDLELMLRQAFIRDTDGEIALNLANIT